MEEAAGISTTTTAPLLRYTIIFKLPVVKERSGGKRRRMSKQQRSRWSMKALFAKSNMKVISLLIPLLLILVYSRAAKGFHNFLAPLDGAMQTHFIIITLSFLTHLHRENSLKSTLPISNQESLPKCRLFRDVVRAHGRYIFGRYTFRCCILDISSSYN